MYAKSPMNSVLDETITKTMIRKMYRMMHVYRNICLRISKVNVTVFLGNVSITLIDKTNGKDPIKRENYWMRALKIYARLIIEDTA